jgi:hypothetical protein
MSHIDIGCGATTDHLDLLLELVEVVLDLVEEGRVGAQRVLHLLAAGLHQVIEVLHHVPQQRRVRALQGVLERHQRGHHVLHQMLPRHLHPHEVESHAVGDGKRKVSVLGFTLVRRRPLAAAAGSPLWFSSAAIIVSASSSPGLASAARPPLATLISCARPRSLARGM